MTAIVGAIVAAFVSAFVGAFVELCQLLLLFSGAILGAGIAGAPTVLVVVAVYAAFVLYPARDLIQGWLGLFAGFRPERYRDRWENAGRGIVALAGSVAILCLPIADRRESHESQGFELAFLGLAVIVFGIGGAIPRLWFAFRSEGDTSTELPELLRQAGWRGAAFFYCAFLGIGLALVAGHSSPVQAHEAHAPAELASDDATFQRAWPRFVGRLCQTATTGCPHAQVLDFVAPRSTDITVTAFISDDILPLCTLVPSSVWPDDAHDHEALARHLLADDVEASAPIVVAAGEWIALRVTLPANAARCSYWIDIEEPAR
ncbi:MAG: hypothetical protein ABI467_20140 [Kofleriaceae bacterium]